MSISRESLGPRVAALGLFGIVLLLSACEYRAASGADQALREEEERATRPDQVSRDVRFFIYEDDRPRVLVEAARMERYTGGDSTYTLLRGPRPADSSGNRPVAAAAGRKTRVTAHIFDRAPAQSSQPSSSPPGASAASATIRSDRLVYDDEGGRFVARGRVVVTTTDGKRLESEHLSWLEEEERIVTPGFVEITTPTDRIQGYGLRAEEDLETYQLRRVTGQVTVEDTP